MNLLDNIRRKLPPEEKTGRSGPVFLISLCKMCMGRPPLLQFDLYPETVNAQRDDGKKEPLDPVAKKLHRAAVKAEPSAFDDGMLRLPLINQTIGPGKTNSQSQCGDHGAQDMITNQLQQASIKIRIVNFQHFFSFLLFLLTSPFALPEDYKIRAL